MSLLKKAATRKRLRSAWDQIRHRPESRGYDEQTVRDFESNLKGNLESIRTELLSGGYRFQKLRGLPLDRGPGKDPRALRIPSVRDRVVQKAIELTIYPLLKARYPIENDSSFAYIKGRSVLEAALKIRALHLAGYNWVYEADIKKFFDQVPREKLLKEFVFPALPDRSIDVLIENALNAELGNAEELKRADQLKHFPAASAGIPQGGVLSPLFANVYLAPLDTKMREAGFTMVRYADDFLVMCKSHEEAVRAEALAQRIVTGDLELHLYPLVPEKVGDKHGKISKFFNIEFIGLQFRGDKILPAPKVLREIVSSIKGLSREYQANVLANALTSIRMRVMTWAATYYFTDIEEVVRHDIDTHLVRAMKELMQTFRLLPGKGFDLKRLGVPSFSDALAMVRAKKQAKVGRNVAQDMELVAGGEQ